MPVDYIRKHIIPEARTMLRLARECLLAGFANMDAEAERAMNDASALALERYYALAHLHQATKNLLAVQMYHLFEQQEKDYRENGRRLGEGFVRVRNAAARLPSLATLNELRLVANVAKHGEDRRRSKLRALRPDLFVNPLLSNISTYAATALARAPFAGIGLYVQDEDLDKYEAAVLRLWEEIAVAHTRAVRESAGGADP